MIDNLLLLSHDIHILISTSNEGGGPDQFGCTKTRFLRPSFYTSKKGHFWAVGSYTPTIPTINSDSNLSYDLLKVTIEQSPDVAVL